MPHDTTTAGTGTARPALCLVTGATGYVGGRLVPELLDAGFRVRCMTRSRARLRDQPWIDRVEVAEADASDNRALEDALDGVDVAYYLIHSLAGGPRFEEADREAARSFAFGARAAGIGRLVYLGGLAPHGRELSPHMRSRAEVGDILLGSGVPTVVLRAAVILGSGSASFEMLRNLTERLPVMIAPKWVSSRVQPIAIRDVLRYLVHAADLPPEVCGTFDIGGPDVLTYEEMMQRFAALAGLNRRTVVRVPLLSTRLSSLWIGLVTPIPGTLARPLVESLHHDAVCRDHAVARYIPDPPEGLTGFNRAVRLALQRVREAVVATRWCSGSLPGTPGHPLSTDPPWSGGSLYEDLRERTSPVPAPALWAAVEAIGGETGWYSPRLPWQMRGLIDLLVGGGAGVGRGRRDPRSLRVGDTVDLWRVEELVPGRLLRLRAEMRLPGVAWLELRVEGEAPGTRYVQRALFYPRGLAGLLYWTALKPFHAVVFGSMARNIVAAGAASAAETGTVRDDGSRMVPTRSAP